MKKLFLDYEKFTKTRDFKTECDLFYHPDNDGVASLIETAAFAVVCRKCEEAPCKKACTKDAIEKQEDGVVARYNMRCCACKSCVIACPFGTLYPEAAGLFAHKCDCCVSSLKDESPLCVKTASDKEVLQYIDIKEDKNKDLFAVGKNLIVHAIPWKEEKAKKK